MCIRVETRNSLYWKSINLVLDCNFKQNIFSKQIWTSRWFYLIQKKTSMMWKFWNQWTMEFQQIFEGNTPLRNYNVHRTSKFHLDIRNLKDFEVKASRLHVLSRHHYSSSHPPRIARELLINCTESIQSDLWMMYDYLYRLQSHCPLLPLNNSR